MLGSVPNKNKRRFTLLMLDDKEYYFEDYGGYLHLPLTGSAATFTQRTKYKGRIHIASKALIFESDDVRYPIIRLTFANTASIKPRKAMDNGTAQDYLLLHTREVIEIQPNTPYLFNKIDLTSAQSEYAISLSYVEINKILPLINKLHNISKLTSGDKDDEYNKIINLRENAIQFESAAISDIRERIVLPSARQVLASQVTPLVTTPGCFMMTDMRVYFQPFNNVSSDPVYKYDIADIKRVYKRRHIMRDTGLEIFYVNKAATTAKHNTSSSWGSKWSGGSTSSSSSNNNNNANSAIQQISVFYTFHTKLLRDQIYDLLLRQNTFKPIKEFTLNYIQEQWLCGKLNNYDYLMFLNQQAGRSFQDLTQYPVFPWIITNYTSKNLDLNDPKNFRDLSKPIGALEPKRLESLKKRMKEMPLEVCNGQPFLYGTHYSSPGYVLYYLVRKCPQYQIRLQAGKFDQPDRLFISITSTWDSCLVNPADVKELIPEFYAIDLPKSGDFLTNELGLDLGTRQSGRDVEDVELPNWAKSPKDFIMKNRAALDSDYVSQHLHEWIDLIFGYKQTGEEAIKADNMFFYLTYEGAVDLDSIQDPQERRSLELQINEFGQTPKQIFKSPHPKRFTQQQIAQFEAAASSASPSDTEQGSSASSPMTHSRSPSVGAGKVPATLHASLSFVGHMTPDHRAATVSPTPPLSPSSSFSFPDAVTVAKPDLAAVAQVVSQSKPAAAQDDDDRPLANFTSSQSEVATNSVHSVPAAHHINSAQQSKSSPPRRDYDHDDDDDDDEENVIDAVLPSPTNAQTAATSVRPAAVIPNNIPVSKPTVSRHFKPVEATATSPTTSTVSQPAATSRYDTVELKQPRQIATPSTPPQPTSTHTPAQINSPPQTQPLQKVSQSPTSPAPTEQKSAAVSVSAAQSSAAPPSISRPVPTSEYDFVGADRVSGRALYRLPADVSKLKRTHLLTVHRHEVNAVHLSAMQNSLLSVSADGAISLYSLNTNQILRNEKISNLALSSVTALPNLSHAAIGGWDNKIYTFGLHTGRVEATMRAHDDVVSSLHCVNSTLFSTSWDCSAKSWAVTNTGVSASPIVTLDDHDSPIHASAVNAVASLIVCGCEDGSVKVWDIRSRQLVREFSDQIEQITAVTFNDAAGDNDVFVASMDNTLKRIDARTGKCLFTHHSHDRLNGIICDDARLIVGGEDGTLRCLDGSKGTEMSKLMLHLGTINSIAAAQTADNGLRLAVATNRTKDNECVMST